MFSRTTNNELRVRLDLPRLAADWIVAREARDYIAGLILCTTAGAEAL